MRNLKIAIASGKGGTGKTTVATNLSSVAAQADWNVAYVDCDVEEPNGHIFLKPTFEAERPVNKLVPQVDAQRCAACGECVRFCQFHALVCARVKVRVYPELCHAYGGCRLVCPQNAINESLQEIGHIQCGYAGEIRFIEGKLAVEAVPGLRRTFAQLLLRLASALNPSLLTEEVRGNLERIIHSATEPPSAVPQTAGGRLSPVGYLALGTGRPGSARARANAPPDQ